MWVTHDLPFANGRVLSIDGNRLTLEPGQPELQADQQWFFWAVTVWPDGADAIELIFPQGCCLTAQGPAISTDNGHTWRWLGRQADGTKQAHDRCTVPVPPGTKALVLSMCIPYQQAQWDAFIAKLPADRMNTDQLCVSTAGRPVPQLRLGAPAQGTVIITARHHACEASASFVLEGLIQRVLDDDRWLPWLADHGLRIIPFMDTDGVTTAQQGKFRAPHDHNADYQDRRYPEVQQLQDMAKRCNPLLASIDLHSPWIRDFEPGSWNENAYQVGSCYPSVAAAQRRFQSLLVRAVADTNGSIPYQADDLLPYGEAWNTRPAGTNRNCSRWMHAVAGAVMASTIETPYADVHGVATSPENLRAFGSAIADALHEWLHERG